MLKLISMPPKKMTIDDLAAMVQRGFEQTASKEELTALSTKVDQLAVDVETVKRSLARIEGNTERRIERLEDNMRRVLTALKLT
jgi:hypothetical protein